MISKWEEVLANRGNPFKGHLPSYGSEPLPEWGEQEEGVAGAAGGVHENKGSPQCPEEEPEQWLTPSDEGQEYQGLIQPSLLL